MLIGVTMKVHRSPSLNSGSSPSITTETERHPDMRRRKNRRSDERRSRTSSSGHSILRRSRILNTICVLTVTTIALLSLTGIFVEASLSSDSSSIPTKDFSEFQQEAKDTRRTLLQRLLRGGSSTSRSTSTISTGTGAATGVDANDDGTGLSTRMIRVAYQGEPGAYSEKATRELLGQNVVAVGRPNFEACFRAVANMECDYACLPIENSLGGSIHENYDLMLRYDLTIVGEHEFRVHHCLLAKPGVKREQIKYAISHPQALAQCDNFLRGLGITPVPTYDTAGSAKMIAEDSDKMPPQCTPDNTAAIASDLAAKTYGLNCLDIGIEDDDTNFTRFLLLSRTGLVEYLTKKIPAKTSVVFTLPNAAGALYKALACFALRDIDCSKIESRPTSASLLNFLKFKSQQTGRKSRNQADLPRFRYCFYLDFLANQLDENTQNALAHLREQADFVRILGSYPSRSRLVGPVAAAVERLKHMTGLINPKDVSLLSLPSDAEDTKPLNIGIIGFDAFGQYIGRRLALKHRVKCMDKADKVCVVSSRRRFQAIS